MTNEPITVVCWKWNGWRPIYEASHVNRLYAQLKKHMTGEWRLVCITDDARGIDPEVDVFPLWPLPNAKPTHVKTGVVPNSFVRLRMFDGRVQKWFGPLVLSLDLDSTVFADLRPLIRPAGFVGWRGRHSPVCGGMWQLRVGACQRVWDEFDVVESPKRIAETKRPDGRPYSGSDQAWLSVMMPDAEVWTQADGVLDHVDIGKGPIPAHARIAQTWGEMKPWSRETKRECPSLYEPVTRTAEHVIELPRPAKVRSKAANSALSVVCYMWNDVPLPAASDKNIPQWRRLKERREAARAGLRSAGREYLPEHVNALQRQFARFLPEKHRFICITDSPEGLSPDVEFLETPAAARALAKLPSPEGARFPSCYRRLWTWSDEAQILGDRVLLTDIDTMLLDTVSHLIDNDEDFIGWRPKLSWGVQKRVAGGLYLVRPGAFPQVWTGFRGQSSVMEARRAGYRGSDQAWISYKMAPNAPVWSSAAGIYSIRDLEHGDSVPDDACLVSFNGPRKPWQFTATEKPPWVAGSWREAITPVTVASA